MIAYFVKAMIIVIVGAQGLYRRFLIHRRTWLAQKELVHHMFTLVLGNKCFLSLSHTKKKEHMGHKLALVFCHRIPILLHSLPDLFLNLLIYIGKLQYSMVRL